VIGECYVHGLMNNKVVAPNEEQKNRHSGSDEPEWHGME
jgi:hypothetical protein